MYEPPFRVTTVPGDARHLLGSRPSEETIRSVRQSIERLKGLSSSQMHGRHNEMYDRYANIAERNYNAFQESAYLYSDARHHAGQVVLDNNRFRVLDRLEDIATAPLVMQPWIMAHPGLNRLYREGAVFGYEDTFVDEYAWLPVDCNPYYLCIVTNGWYGQSAAQHSYTTIDIPHLPDEYMEIVAYAWQIIDAALMESWDPTAYHIRFA